jgi:hypothetical protein
MTQLSKSEANEAVQLKRRFGARLRTLPFQELPSAQADGLEGQCS